MNNRRDNFYMSVAINAAKESHAIRAKVGAVITKDDNILSYGWNGMPAGMDNSCENTINGELITKPECVHAETNAIGKLAKTTGGTNNSTLYVTLSPCVTCANLIKAAGITRVVYKDQYRLPSGIEFLRNNLGIMIEKYGDNTATRT
jgi:dCMP deaminase